MIDQGATIGRGSRIWHFCHVCSNAKIGTNVSLGQGVFVGDNVIIGNDCKIQNNVSLYDGVILEKNVFCGPSVVFTNVINPRAHVVRKQEYRQTLVMTGVTLGANSTIVCGITIGAYAFIGAGAVVTKPVPDFALMTGVPAVRTGWMSVNGDRLDLPVFGQGQVMCSRTGQFYILDGDILELQQTI